MLIINNRTKIGIFRTKKGQKQKRGEIFLHPFPSIINNPFPLIMQNWIIIIYNPNSRKRVYHIPTRCNNLMIGGPAKESKLVVKEKIWSGHYCQKFLVS